MSAFFLRSLQNIRKQSFLRLGKAVLFLFVAGVLFYAQFLSGVQSVDVTKNFYFLVLDSTHIEVSTHQTQTLGGAGFLLNENRQDYVVLSVYLKSDEGERVLDSVLQTAKNAKLVTIKSGNLYFKTLFDKQKADFYVGAFDTLYSLIEVLNNEISRLDKGATQESSKRILGIYQKQFTYLQKKYQEGFSAFSSVCGRASKELFKIMDGIVYAKDLRYLLCELCVAYTDLSKEFYF